MERKVKIIQIKVSLGWRLGGLYNFQNSFPMERKVKIIQIKVRLGWRLGGLYNFKTVISNGKESQNHSDHIKYYQKNFISVSKFHCQVKVTCLVIFFLVLTINPL